MKELVKDGRKVDPKTMDEIRMRAVAAVQRGHSPEQVVEIFGFSRSSIYVWLARYEQGGWEALRTAPRSGRPRRDDAVIRTRLWVTVTTSTPQDWGFETVLWTRPILAQLLGEWFDLEVSDSTVGRWLHELDLSPQQPVWQAREQDPEAVRHFVEEKFPRIVRLAQKLGAEIFFVDEFGYGAGEHAGRTWGPVGQPPVVTSTGQRFRCHVLSAVSASGQLRFKVFERPIGAEQFLEFLRALVQGSERPVVVLADRHVIHRAGLVRQLMRPWRDRFKLFRLPAYSPEYNPVEEVPNELKNHVLGKKAFRTKADLKAKLYQALRSLQKKTQRIVSFFHKPTTAYAMAYV
jgi:transposase